MWETIAKATRQATVKHLLNQGEENIDCDKLTEALKETLANAIPELQAEWKSWNEIRVKQTQIKWGLNIQANDLAAKAIMAYRRA